MIWQTKARILLNDLDSWARKEINLKESRDRSITTKNESTKSQQTEKLEVTFSPESNKTRMSIFFSNALPNHHQLFVGIKPKTNHQLFMCWHYTIASRGGSRCSGYREFDVSNQLFANFMNIVVVFSVNLPWMWSKRQNGTFLEIVKINAHKLCNEWVIIWSWFPMTNEFGTHLTNFPYKGNQFTTNFVEWWVGELGNGAPQNPFLCLQFSAFTVGNKYTLEVYFLIYLFLIIYGVKNTCILNHQKHLTQVKIIMN